MANASRITCITKPDPYDTHEAIQYVGGRRDYGAGVPFYISREQCAREVRNDATAYYVYVDEVAFVEAYERNGTWYIKTKPDKTKKDNLLSLAQCTASEKAS